MKRMLLATACAIVPAMVMSTAAMADCRKDLRRIGHIEATSAEAAGMSAAQIQDVKRAAAILASGGHEDACLEIVAVLSDVQSGDAMKRTRSNSNENAEAGQNRRQEGGEGLARAESGDDAYRSENRERLAKAKQAEPVLDAKGNFSVGALMGADVYSAKSGNKLGEIEDLIMGSDNRQVIIGHGGFLGLGEKNIKISMEDLLVNQNDNSYYIRMSDRQIKRLPGLEKENGRWTQAAVDAASSESDMMDMSDDNNRNSSSANRTQNRDNQNWLTDEDPKEAKREMRSAGNAERASIGKALTEQQGTLSANRIIGEDVYSSSTGDAVGDVEDLIVGLGGGEHYIILSHGGFLGLGEKRVKLKLGDLRYNPNEEEYVVGLTDEKLTQLPGLKKVDGQWTGKAVDASQSSQNRTN